MDYYLFCEDQELVSKAKKICNLYRNPPKDVVLLSYDERTGMQALERKKILFTKPGKIMKQEFEYKRHGTQSLLGCFNVKTGKVFGKCYDRHTQNDFLNFMKKIKSKYKNEKVIIVMDNLQSHKTPAVKKWLKKQNGMIEFVFTPTHASWLNQIELWFRELNKKCLKRLSVGSKGELIYNVKNFIKTYNKYHAHPYNWKFNGILKKVAA